MLLKSSKSILTTSVVFIGGLVFVMSQPVLVLANNQYSYTPIERPRPLGTQGGGSR